MSKSESELARRAFNARCAGLLLISDRAQMSPDAYRQLSAVVDAEMKAVIWELVDSRN